ncbi:tail fiber protein [Providencia stuartii]|uniref:tail fiber protein n=1 Tax=Providencia TaxID=586 RepID=UPI0034D4595E
MSVIKKPDLKIFAQDAKTGEIETFPDVLRGWGITLDRTAGKPPLEWFNAIGKRVDEWLMYLTQRGVAEWDATLSYPKTAIVQWNGVIYVSNKETKGEQPDKSQAAWSTLGVFLGLGNYYTKTDTDTKFQLKGNYALKGESYTKVESDTRFQPKGNYLPSGYSYSKSESDTKYQPKGNYAPAGDYATNTALKNGLNGKFDKTGGNIEGLTRVKNTLDANMVQVTGKDDAYMQLDMSVANVARINSKRAGKQWCNHILPDVSGTIMQVGDYGWGGAGPYKGDGTDEGFLAIASEAKTQVFRANKGNAYQYIYSPTLMLAAGDAWSSLCVDYRNGNIVVAAGLTNDVRGKNYLYGTVNTTKDHNGNLKVSGSSSELSDYPVGAPIPWPQSTAPAGYLICNGQAFNKTTYPLLAKAYPSGKLPDLRGEFIRGLDAGRNIDNGRVVLSAQTDAIQNIKGEISISSEKTPSSGSSGAFTSITANGTVVTSSFVTRQIQKFSFDASNSARTANETRPRNIAFLYIVRAA